MGANDKAAATYHPETARTINPMADVRAVYERVTDDRLGLVFALRLLGEGPLHDATTPDGEPISPTAEAALGERLRQVQQLGRTVEADALQFPDVGQAGLAYCSYAIAAEQFGLMPAPDELGWPWPPELFKPHPTDHHRTLVKGLALLSAAGDVIVAEREIRA